MERNSVSGVFFRPTALLGAIPAGILGLIAFVLQLVGLLRLKDSTVIGPDGAPGVTLLLAAVGIIVLASLLGIIPFTGGFIKSAIAFLAFLIIPFGWIKIQSALLEYKLKAQIVDIGDRQLLLIDACILELQWTEASVQSALCRAVASDTAPWNRRSRRSSLFSYLRIESALVGVANFSEI
jgi:hypothetical protein